LLQARAQGNPFYLEEMITALRDLGKLYFEPREERWLLAASVLQTLRTANCITKDPATNDWVLLPDAPLASIDLEIPAAVHQLVLARADRLPEECKLTLKVASVIGRTFGVDLLMRAHPAQPQPAILQQHLRLLEQNSLIYPNSTSPQPRYGFHHSMTQEVIYNALVEQQQQLVHGAVGYAWESIDDQAIEQLAYHFQRSSVRHKSLHYLALAARKAQHSYANHTALNYYNQALALEARWEWQQGRIEVLHILGQRAEERAALEALRTQPDAPAFALAYLWGDYYEAISHYVEAEAAFQQALTNARAQASLLGEVRCLAQLGFIHWRRGDATQAQSCYQQVLTFLQARPTRTDDEQHVLTQTLTGLGTLYRQQGQLSQAEEVYQQALAISRTSRNRLEEARALDNLGVVAFHGRHYEQALSYHEAALQLRRMIGDRTGEGASLCNLALDYQEQGDYGRALACLSRAQAIHQVTGNRWEEVNVFIDLGILYTELGVWSQARTHLEKGLAVAESINDSEGRVYLLSNLGLVALFQGQWTEAEKHLSEGLLYMQREENQYQIAFFLSYLALVQLATGALEQAQAHASQALIIRQTLGLRVRTADNLALLAAIHLARQEITPAMGYAQQALTILNECQGVGPEFPQQDYFTCYQVFAVHGEQEAAHHALRAAYQLVMQRVQQIGDQELQRSFVERVPVNRDIIACAQRELGLVG
jgi:tetratricopeptide (TPR) repeat protein